MDALPWGGGIGLLWPLDFFGEITGVHWWNCWVVLRPMMAQLLVRYSGRSVLELGRYSGCLVLEVGLVYGKLSPQSHQYYIITIRHLFFFPNYKVQTKTPTICAPE